MLQIPLQAVPKQYVTVTLSEQVCQINVYQTNFGLFLDLLSNGNPIVYGVIGENLNPMIRAPYLGFDGELAWIDNQGSDDPYYTGLGTRFSLVYLTAAELAGA